jgi:hypothetical protein
MARFNLFALLIVAALVTSTTAIDARDLKKSKGRGVSKGSKGTAAPTVSAAPTAASKAMKASKIRKPNNSMSMKAK